MTVVDELLHFLVNVESHVVDIKDHIEEEDPEEKRKFLKLVNKTTATISDLIDLIKKRDFNKGELEKLFIICKASLEELIDEELFTFDNKQEERAFFGKMEDLEKKISSQDNVEGKFEGLRRDLSDKKISTLNSELGSSATGFLMMAFEFFDKFWPSELNRFNRVIQEYPVIDLACGAAGTVNDSQILKVLFGNEDLVVHGRFKIPNFSEPKLYIGVDKYQDNDYFSKPPKILFVQEDMVIFLRKQKKDFANIFIGGFDYDVSRPQIGQNDDEYRLLLLMEMGRVVPKGGYVLSANSLLHARFEDQGFSLKDFGFVKIERKEHIAFHDVELYRKRD